MAFTFATTPTLLCGASRIAACGTLVDSLLGRTILVITDAGIVKAGLLPRLLDPLSASGAVVSVFDGVLADPAEAIVLAATAAARNARASGVIGFGGGSAMDVAKLVAVLAGGDQRLEELYGVGQARGKRLPLLLIPTTAGTGSEVTPIAIITTGAAEKKGVVAPLLLPDAALLDAELTLGLPAAVTAATGIDAMVHAIEACTSTSPNNNPVSQGLARQALLLLGGSIEQAVADGSDLAAREAMLLGACLAGQAFANAPVAAVHALAYPLGGHFHLPHGLTNALMLVEVMRFNRSHAAAAYASLLPLIFPQSAAADTTADDRAELLITALAALIARLGLPRRLRDAGVPADALELLAADAMKQTRLLVNNPRPLNASDALAIYRAAW